MFTGIVTQRAAVTELMPLASGAVRLAIELERPIAGSAVGDSVAIDGVCLTVVAVGGRDGRRVEFEAVPETLRKTTLGARRVGERLNIEPAMRMGDPIGGHLVQGHVDGVGTVRAVERRGDDVRLVVSLPDAMRGAALSKGSIAIDGVSLTVGECGDDWFSVYLIPHTLAVTGLSSRRVGDGVNLEADVVGRYVEHHVQRYVSRSLASAAARAGLSTGKDAAASSESLESPS